MRKSEALWRNGDSTSRLLLDLASGRHGSEFPLAQDALLLAHRHGLVGLLVDQGGELGSQAFPSFVRSTARQKVMISHLQRVLELLHGEGIRAAVLKGPYLAETVYRRPHHRTFTDVDVLVPREHLKRALLALVGYEAVTHIPAQGPKADKRNIPLKDPSGVRFTLDLHWDLFSYSQLQHAASGATESAWAESDGPRATSLGPLWHLPEAATICFLCTHALLDHRFRLILFRDLTEVALRRPDWDEVGRFAQKWSLRSSTYTALLIASRITDAEVPAEFLKALRPATMAIAATERLLRRTDLVRFDGHRPHPLNLSIVLLHDSPIRRLRLAANAFVAFPEWKRRVGLGTRPRPRLPAKPAPSGVVILVTSDRRRGAEVFGERLAAELRQRSWEVNLLALSTDQAEPRIQASAVVGRSTLPLGRLDARVVAGLRRSINRLQPGLILANGSSTLQYAVAATRFMRRPIKLIYSSIGEPLYWIRGRGRRLIQRSLLSRADLVLAVSEATRQQLVEGLGMPEESVVVAPTGVPEAFFAIRQTQRLGGAFRLLFLGNLSSEKNPMAALEVTRRLLPTTPVELRFVGEGPLLDPLRKAVSDFGLDGAVAFEGSATDVAPHLSWADLLLLTSDTEGLPGVVLEAAAAGLPAVSFDVGGVSETIVDGVTGELVHPGDITALTTAIERLSEDRPRLAEMGVRAREHVAEHYALAQAVDRYEEAIANVLSPNQKRSEPARSPV